MAERPKWLTDDSLKNILVKSLNTSEDVTIFGVKFEAGGRNSILKIALKYLQGNSLGFRYVCTFKKYEKLIFKITIGTL